MRCEKILVPCFKAAKWLRISNFCLQTNEQDYSNAFKKIHLDATYTISPCPSVSSADISAWYWIQSIEELVVGSTTVDHTDLITFDTSINQHRLTNSLWERRDIGNQPRCISHIDSRKTPEQIRLIKMNASSVQFSKVSVSIFCAWRMRNLRYEPNKRYPLRIKVEE